MGALTPWQRALVKRGRKQARLVKLANQRLEQSRADADVADINLLPPHHILGVHLGLIVLTNCSHKVVEIRSRARWMLHWMLGYILEQGFTLEEATTTNALDALELLVTGAAQAKEAHPHQLQFKLGRLLDVRGDPIRSPWTDVYDSAWAFIGALNNLA